MPANKDLKRLVRARMRKTGEAYTTARAQIAKKPKVTPAPAPVAALAARAEPAPQDYAKLAGMSDDVMKAKTGCDWTRWVTALDYYGAETMSHREIAQLVKSKYKVADWWTQAVTVGYERIKGLRARGQRRDGTYEASKSRTFDVPVAKLFDAWAKPARRKKWLDAPDVKLRTAMPPKSVRLGWSDGGIVAVWFTAKGKTKSSVAVQHAKLSDKETADRLKQYWSERLDALGEVLTGA
ncbi:MAG: hypothetical protein NUW01_14705 [Gemmatimonadaceae bacterium]|nr:hypothetical protein [Gemmatimonadaceae bacterium]